MALYGDFTYCAVQGPVDVDGSIAAFEDPIHVVGEAAFGASRKEETVRDDHMGAGRPEPIRTDYMTPGEAARSLHVSPKTINRWANEGRIPCIVTLGGHRRFRREDIDAAGVQMSERGVALAELAE